MLDLQSVVLLRVFHLPELPLELVDLFLLEIKLLDQPGVVLLGLVVRLLQEPVDLLMFPHLCGKLLRGDCLLDLTLLDPGSALVVTVDGPEIVLLLVLGPTAVLLHAELLVTVHALFHLLVFVIIMSSISVIVSNSISQLVNPIDESIRQLVSYWSDG